MLVVDASVGLKWVLQEADSPLAERLARSDVDLLVPDFWLHEACNVLWLQVRRGCSHRTRRGKRWRYCARR
jgi:predicted nucleic acid-binding protein